MKLFDKQNPETKLVEKDNPETGLIVNYIDNFWIEFN